MKELFKIAYQSLKENKTRTLFTFFSIILSVFLMSSLLILNQSKTTFLNRQDLYSSGDYQLRYHDNEIDSVKSLVKEDQIASETKVYTQGYVKQADHVFIEMLAMDAPTQIEFAGLAYGAYPTNEQELMVSKNYAESQSYEVGDTITLPIINVGQNFDVQNINTLSEKDAKSHTYTITGIFDSAGVTYHPNIIAQMMSISSDTSSMMLNEGYLKLQNITKGELLTISEKLENNGVNYLYNEQGVDILFHDQHIIDPTTILLLCVLCFFLIQLTTNIFKMSLNSKKKFVGIMKSLGATNTQVYGLGLCEAFLYCVFCIPIGIIAGYFIMDLYLAYLATFDSGYLPFSYEISFSFISFLFTILFNVIFIFFSCLYPYYKIRKKQSIQLIKEEDSVVSGKIKNTRNRSVHMEYLIAKRNQKRNRQGYRSVQSSIFISIIVLCGSAYLYHENTEIYEKQMSDLSVELVPAKTMEEVEQAREFIDTISVNSLIDSYSFRMSISPSIDIPSNLVLKETRDTIRPSGGNILGMIEANSNYELQGNEAVVNNTFYLITSDKEKVQYQFFDLKNNKILELPVLSSRKKDSPVLAFEVVDTEDDEDRTFDETNVYAAIPKIYCSMEQIGHIMSYTNTSDNIQIAMGLTIQTYDTEATLQYLNQYMKEHPNIYFTIHYKANILESLRTEKIFMYGIALVLVAISILHLFSIMLTNLVVRKKEYAVLLSMGLENRQLLQLLFYENCVSVLKGLLFGLPAGLLSCYIIYKEYLLRTEVFSLPYGMMAGVVIFVILIVYVVTMVGYRILRTSNIAEYLKDGES